MSKHVAIYISNQENKKLLLKRITSGEVIKGLDTLKGFVFSEVTINKFINEETQHGHFDIKTETKNSLKNSSQGERKKALLNHILLQNPDFIVLDNVFDCLDIQSQYDINKKLHDLADRLRVIQIATRRKDILTFIDDVYTLNSGKLEGFDDQNVNDDSCFKSFANQIPTAYSSELFNFESLITLNRVSVNYQEKHVLKNISWQVKPNEFWQLIGPNGSGKSTILTLISGDNPKAYQQDITLFGIKKGSGETVWDIKKHIGFFSSEMLRGFKRSHTIENMIISGFLDSIGLYKYPTDLQKFIAHQWLHVLNMFHLKDKSFQSLSNGHKRLVLIARAMVKQPPLLILDEPINGLDDNDAKLFSELITKISKETSTAIIYVSHRKERHIHPDFIYELIPQKSGSIGKIVTVD